MTAPQGNPQTRGPKRWYLAAGVVVIAVALWILLEAAGIPVPAMGRYWPVLVILGAIAYAVDFFIGSRSPSSLGRGVAGFAAALFFLAFTTGDWRLRDVGDWWPAVPAILGAGFLTTWLAGPKKHYSSLVLGVTGLGLGLTGLAARYDFWARLIPSPAVAWAVLLLLVGTILLFKFLTSRGDTPPPNPPPADDPGPPPRIES